MAKYVIKFSKEGYFKYTSHLDLLRFFKRSFKRVGIKLDYSHGFNPHPKMSFAQPLSLGYSSIGEVLEFETSQDIIVEDIKSRLEAIMPEGLKILDCVQYNYEGKALAALTDSAEYKIVMPIDIELLNGKGCDDICEQFLLQEHIFVKKKKKKSKELVKVDIKNKIRKLIFSNINNQIVILSTLDAGSESNLSPELLISAIIEFLRVDVSRYDIDVTREKITFTNKFTI